MTLRDYEGISPKSDIQLLRLLGRRFKGRELLNVNSTRAGGGVAEILHRLVPLVTDLGIKIRWEVIEGDGRFFEITKKIHNALQGRGEVLSPEMWEYHMEINRRNAIKMDLEADYVMIHDPQPVPLVKFRKRGIWAWRCHIDSSSPLEPVWDMVLRYVRLYDALIFSTAKYSKPLTQPVPEFTIMPSIDPVSEKNRELTGAEIQEVARKHDIPSDRPIILQVSRFDRFKDPLGVIDAYRQVKKYNDCVLVLAGSSATDDPEGPEVLEKVQEHAAGDRDIRVLLLPPFSDLDINALQRMASVVVQKSVKEGFGLTVSEAMWKGKPVVGGAVGGIPFQIINGVNGFLIYSVEGAAFRIRQFLNNKEMLQGMGERAREHVRANFLITRQIRDYLAAWYALEHKGQYVLETSWA
jgi:trehalose synthase